MKQITYGVYWWQSVAQQPTSVAFGESNWYADGSPAGCLSVTTRYDAEYWCNEMEEAGFPAAWIVEPQ